VQLDGDRRRSNRFGEQTHRQQSANDPRDATCQAGWRVRSKRLHCHVIGVTHDDHLRRVGSFLYGVLPVLES